jgi:Flp pilus assembly protein protease CpaA
MKPHRGTLILIFGILGLVICGFFGIAAWAMGSGDLKLMDAGQMDPSGRSNTNAGRICGMIATILMIVGFVVGIALFALGILGAATHR